MSTPELIGTPVHEGIVLPEWIDVNQHMNVAYYVLAFDYGTDALWNRLGITTEYIESSRGSTFAVESHVTYQREIHEGDAYIVTSQVLGYDEKRIHQFQRLYHAKQKFVSATAEWLSLHVDLECRRVSPWPQQILDRFADFAAGQEGQEKPTEVGRRMTLENPLYSL